MYLAEQVLCIFEVNVLLGWRNEPLVFLQVLFGHSLSFHSAVAAFSSLIKRLGLYLTILLCAMVLDDDHINIYVTIFARRLNK